MKLIKTMLVGVFVLSMIFAQQNPPASGQNPPPGGNPGGPPPGGNPGGPPPGGNPGGPPPGGTPGGPGGPGGDMDHQSAAQHYMMAVQEGMDRGVLDANDQQYLMGMVPKMKAAVDSEYNEGGEAAGEVADEFREWLQGLYDEGGESAEVAKRLAMELCMVEAEAHRMNDPDGDHDDGECHDDGGDHNDGGNYDDGGDHDDGDHNDGGDHDDDGDHDDGGNYDDGNDHDGGDHGPMGGPMGPNFDEANCMALEHNSPEFWVDHNQNGEKDTVTMDDVAGTDYEGEPWKSPDYEGPYGTYHEYEDGSPVDCGGGNHQGGNHQGGNQGGPDAPSQAVVNAWMSGAQEGGGFNFDAAFNAAEAQAKAEAQAEGEYFGDDAWNQCADAGRAAMQEARDDNKSPQEVFQYVGQAVNACGEAQAAANQD